MDEDHRCGLVDAVPLIWTARLLEMVARGQPLARVMDELCRQAEDLIGDCWCGVVLVDPTGDRLERAAAPTLPDSFVAAINGRVLHRDSGPNAMAAQLDEPVVAADLASDTRWSDSGWRAMALSHGVRACCATPIRSVAGKVIGAFAVYYREPRTPTAAERTLVDQFTNLASIAIERARAEESILQGTTQLAGENRLLEMIASGRSLSDVLNALCTFVENAAPVCVCGIYPIDWSGPTFQVGAAPSLPASYTAPVEGLPVRCDVAPCGIAASLKTQVIVEDIEINPQWLGSSYRDHVLAHGLRAVWSTPICSQTGHVLGTFCLYQRTAGAPSLRQQELIAQVTHIASIAIERAQAEAALRRSEAFLVEGQRLSLTGTFSWRVATDEIKWSEEIYRIFGVDQATPITMGLFDRIHPDDAPALKVRMERARRETEVIEVEYRLRMPSGSVKHLHIIAHPSRDRNGQLEYIGAVQDVTDRRKSDDALARLRSELAHAARVTSLGALTASIAHEVNQPLSGIITNASTCLRMLAADPPDLGGARETARRTIRDGERASQVIARLRALFSKKTSATDSVDLNEAAREVLALTRSELQRNRIVLRAEFADDLPAVSGDRVQLQQVILNLLLNANEAMSAVEDRPRELLVRTARDDRDGVRLTVRDTGVGFDNGDVNRLFESFYTTKTNGMGIGLSVSRSIIESHDGRLWATLNQGPGATFFFSLPAAQQLARNRRRYQDAATSRWPPSTS